MLIILFIFLLNNPAQELFERGNLYFSAGQYRRAIELDSASAEAFHSRAYTFYYKEQYYDALTDYNRAIELRNNYALSYAGRGLVLIELGYFDRACQDFHRSVELGATKVQKLITEHCKSIKM
jgi:tetratricopeptide (TPR) repeat protein